MRTPYVKFYEYAWVCVLRNRDGTPSVHPSPLTHSPPCLPPSLAHGQVGLLSNSAVLDHVVTTRLPAVARKLQLLDFDWLCLTPEWFVHLFFDVIDSPSAVAHVWDVLLWSPDELSAPALVWAAFSVIESCADELVRCVIGLHSGYSQIPNFSP